MLFPQTTCKYLNINSKKEESIFPFLDYRASLLKFLIHAVLFPDFRSSDFTADGFG